MNNQWVQSSGKWYLKEISNNQEKLSNSIYKLNYDEMTMELYLTLIQEKFELPFKVYGIERDFINRVKKTYQETSSNLGILMNGLRGTGKSVTGKLICNELDLPVIIIHNDYDGIPSFINDIQQNVIIMIDEYEKVYSERDHTVLTVMDGILDNGFKKIFILTTNNLYIEENLVQRPGRIRYLKTFSDLSLEHINEIVDDKLTKPHHKTKTIEFISRLEMITVDIVRAIIEEVNIHDEEPQNFGNIFNIKLLDDMYNIYEIIPNESPKLVFNNSKISPRKFDKSSIGMDFDIDDTYRGDIISVLSSNTIVIELNKNGISVHKQYFIEPVTQVHNVFTF